MTDEKEPSGAETMFGDFAPGLVHFADDALRGDAWRRPGLSPRDRSLITHLAFHAGWPRAFPAMAVAEQVFRGD